MGNGGYQWIHNRQSQVGRVDRRLFLWISPKRRVKSRDKSEWIKYSSWQHKRENTGWYWWKVAKQEIVRMILWHLIRDEVYHYSLRFGAQAGFWPCIHIFNSLHTYFLLAVVAESKIVLFLLAEMNSHLIFSWEKLNVLPWFDVITFLLFFPNPNFDPAEMIFNIGA